MNWENVNLKSDYERSQIIIDSLDFDTLLLEVQCNCREITKEAIIKQFETDLKARIVSARQVLNDNLENILNEALEYRNQD